MDPQVARPRPFSRTDDAKLLCAIHVWDTKLLGANRDWEQIANLALMDSKVAKKRFFELRQDTTAWLPYPCILNKDLENAAECKKIFEPQFRVTDPDILRVLERSTWAQKLDDVELASTLVQPWALRTWQVQHFLGFHKDEALFDKAYKEVRGRLGVEALEQLSKYVEGEEQTKTDFICGDIYLEMEKLLRGFAERRRDNIIPITPTYAVCDLVDIAYYRRPLVNENGEVVREILSDYEMMNFFKQALRDEFDFQDTDADYWKEFMEEWMIGSVDGEMARHDFFKYFLPRIHILKHWLAPELDMSGFSFEEDVVAALRVIYHSSKERTFLSVLRSITVMEKYGWLNLELFGGSGTHQCSFRVILMILVMTQSETLDTNPAHLRGTQSGLTRDLLFNFRRFCVGTRSTSYFQENVYDF